MIRRGALALATTAASGLRRARMNSDSTMIFLARRCGARAIGLAAAGVAMLVGLQPADASVVLGRSSVKVGWNANPEPNVAGYKVLLGTSSGTFSKVQNVGNVTSHSFTGLSSETTYYFAVQAYDDTNQVSELSSVVSFVIPAAVGSFDTWAANGALGGAAADAMASPFGDGLPNLVKFAFNLNPSAADSRVLAPSVGMAGLPSYALDRSGAQPFFTVEYVRRKLSGLVYTPRVTSDFKNFTTMTGTTSVTPIDDNWERVKIQMPAGSYPRLFGRVDVTLPGLVVNQ